MSTANDLYRACELLTAMVDDEPCALDHHGTCQNHSSEVDGRCGNVVAREFLDEMRPGWSL